MSFFFKSKGSLTLAMSAVFLAITLVAGVTAYLLPEGMFSGGSESSSQVEESVSPGDGDEQQEPENLPVMAEVEPPQEREAEQPVHFNVPGEMRGVYIQPGVDYLTGDSPTQDSIKAEIDAALDSAKELTMNTVIIATNHGEGVIYHTSDAPSLYGDFDIMEYLVAGSRSRSLYTYAIFDVTPYSSEGNLTSTMAVGAGSIDRLSENLREFGDKYALDGILIDGYTNSREEDSYQVYLTSGGGIGFGNYLRQSPQALVKTASNTIRTYAKGTQVGLLADSVWENASDNEEGSNTAASFTSLSVGNADTKGFVEEDLVDFVAVKAFSSLTDSAVPFKEVVAWWSGVAQENAVPLYVVHASESICTEQSGWESHDQITKQVIEASGYSGYRGSVFNNLARLSQDPKDATSTLIKYYNNEVEAAHILTELEITKPEQTSYTTFEQVVTFTGASDPNSDVTINGELVQTDANGYFTVTFDLKPGDNTYVIAHKEKTITYQITRQVQIIREVSPTGSITTEGGMSITISAVAYADAQVYAVVGGQTVAMSIDDSVEEEADRDSSYKQFVGEYTAPAATSSEQNVGTIVVHGTWQGISDSMEGASIKVNKKAQLEDGVSVVVTASQARTYPPNTLNNIPSANYYPLPAGAMDYAVGDEIIYKKGSDTYSYYVLASGLRVASADISPSSEFASGNVISGAAITSDSGSTYVTLSMSEKVSYTFKYTSEMVSVEFHYTNQMPDGVNVGTNPLFKSAGWSGTTLNLPLTKTGGFMGYKGYFDDGGNLVLEFNNPPSSISNARIAIDPGHGGSDSGALGFLANYPEKVLNWAIANKLAEELQSRGATVLLIDTSGGMSLEERVRRAESFGADLYVSVHNNTAPNSSATGTEVYYFYPFSYNLANNTSYNVSSRLSTNNRGPKNSYYHVTLSPQFASVLVECGFMTNQSEYEKLIKSSYQTQIAAGIADGIAASIKAVYPGSGGDSSGGGSSGGGLFGTSGSDSAGSASDGGDIPIFQDSGGSSSGSGSELDGMGTLYLEDERITLTVGRTFTLEVGSEQGTVSNSLFTWSSNDSGVASVSSGGKVTAKGDGTATITGVSTDGAHRLTCSVTVTDSEIPVTSITLSNSRLTVAVGETETLAYQISPSNATNSRVSWTSSDKKVATVSSSGKVKGVAEGTATITATSSDGGYIATCKVTVSGSKVELDHLALSESELFLDKGDTVTLKVSVYPDAASNAVTWKSSNTSVAKVDSSGKVTAVRSGEAVITATSTSDKSIYDQCEVYVD